MSIGKWHGHAWKVYLTLLALLTGIVSLNISAAVL